MGLVTCNLLAVGVDTLDEVALLVQEAHSHERQGKITGGLAVVPGQDTKAAGINRKALMETELGAEVGHQSLLRIQFFGDFRAGAGFEVGIVTAQNPAILSQKRSVFRCFVQSVLGDPAEEQFWIVLHFLPEPQVDPGEQATDAMVPAVEQIVGKFFQSLKGFWNQGMGFESKFRCFMHVGCLQAGKRSH